VEDDLLTLTPHRARDLPIDALRETFAAFLDGARDDLGSAIVNVDVDPDVMTVEEMAAFIAEHQDWFTVPVDDEPALDADTRAHIHAPQMAVTELAAELRANISDGGWHLEIARDRVLEKISRLKVDAPTQTAADHIIGLLRHHAIAIFAEVRRRPKADAS
jgi:hypothetical protein